LGDIDVWHPWEEDREPPDGGMKEEAERKPITKRRQEKE
jgi:hypothetical protein